MFKVLDCYRKINYFCRNVSVCKVLQNEDRNHKRKVTETVELVTLVDVNDKILGLKTKSQSEKLAKKLNLLLERVDDPKYGKMYPAYKMLTSADLIKQEKKVSNTKVLKKLPLNSRISDHDLAVKLQIIRKWLDKKCEVHIAILGNNQPEAGMKALFTKIEEQMKNDYRILDVRHKEGSINFILIPPKQTIKKENVKSNQKKNATEGG